MDKKSLSAFDKALKDPYEIEMEDFAATTLEELDGLEARCWSRGTGYIAPHYPMINEKLEGLEAGFYIIAGESNSGKSALLTNLLHDYASHKENKLFGLYFSLDDSLDEIVPRIIAMNQQIPISAVSKPQRLQDKIDAAEEDALACQDLLDKRKAGIEELKENRFNFKVVDGRKIKNAEMMRSYIEKMQIYVKSIDPEMNLIVGIDSLNDVRFSSVRTSSDKERNDMIAKTIKEWAVEFSIPIFGSAHIRKLNANRRPTLDDLKESVEYVYEASLTWLVYNDVSKNNQSANVYYHIEAQEEKQPVMELDWAKNKKSSYKGRTYCYFVPNQSRLLECSADDSRRFNALIYQA